MNHFTYRGKPGWVFVVDTRDGVIEQAEPFETAERCDFHHNFYVRQELLDREREGSIVLAIADAPGQIDLWGDAVDSLTAADKARIVERVLAQLAPLACEVSS